MPSVLQSFIPWILFFLIFGHSAGSAESASIVALLSHGLLNRHAIQKRFVLDLGTLIFFLLFTVNSFIVKWSMITNNGYLIANLAIALVAWISLLIRKPFTLQYARLTVSREITASKLFLFINYILTALWAILLSLMVLPNIIEFYDPTKYASDINIGVSILLVVIGIWITRRFPDWLANQMIEKRFNINIKKIYADHKTAAVDFTEVNTADLSAVYDMSADVIIVGAGPVGLASGLLLQQHGINAIILEKHAGTSIHPKARGISCRSMELFRKLGIEEQVKQFNLPESQTWFGWFSQLTGRLYARVSATTDYQNISSCKPATAAQQYLEKIMLDQFKRLGGKVLFRHQVTNIAQNNDCVQVFTTQRDTQEKLVLQGKYLIAADGAHSTIRQLLKIPMIGPDEISVNCSVYCEMDLNKVLAEDKRFGIAFMVRPGKPAPMVLSIDGKNKWVVIFPAAGALASTLEKIYTDDYIKAQIEDLVGCGQLQINIISKQIWSLGSQVANQFMAGRTILAGDAIHRFAPTGAMGMNTGLQDVDNLIWKLAYVIQAKAHPKILNSYSQERLPSVLDNMQWSLSNLHRIIKIQRGFEQDKLDDVDFQALVQQQEAHLNKSGLDLGLIYESKLISQLKPTKPTIPPDQYQPMTYPGARLPHFELMQAGNIISSLDLVGTKCILLCSEKAKLYVDAIDFKSITTQIIAIGDSGDLREVHKGAFNNLLGLDEFWGLWIRPDGHIAWKGHLNKQADIDYLEKIIRYMTLS